MRIVGWVLFLAAAAAGFRAGALDRQLRKFRRGDVRAVSYWIAPLRFRRDLYTQEGSVIVQRIWRLIGLMYVFGITGALLMALGS